MPRGAQWSEIPLNPAAHAPGAALPAPPPPPPNQDEEHLRLLAIFHYVLAGLVALVSLIPVVHVGLGIAMVMGVFPASSATTPSAPPPEFLGWMFIGVGAPVILIGEALALLICFAGRFIGRRRNRTFVLVISVINCLNVPLGAVLGVLTLIVLSRPSVKAEFEAGGS